ncbi:hypothetical protein HYQ46_005039 [Verticillium longisporum]|nr:hypothetical protein HYQ46_005039 [Verticillium longisporum]
MTAEAARIVEGSEASPGIPPLVLTTKHGSIASEELGANICESAGSSVTPAFTGRRRTRLLTAMLKTRDTGEFGRHGADAGVSHGLRFVHGSSRLRSPAGRHINIVGRGTGIATRPRSCWYVVAISTRGPRVLSARLGMTVLRDWWVAGKGFILRAIVDLDRPLAA